MRLVAFFQKHVLLSFLNCLQMERLLAVDQPLNLKQQKFNTMYAGGRPSLQNLTSLNQKVCKM